MNEMRVAQRRTGSFRHFFIGSLAIGLHITILLSMVRSIDSFVISAKTTNPKGILTANEQCLSNTRTRMISEIGNDDDMATARSVPGNSGYIREESIIKEETKQRLSFDSTAASSLQWDAGEPLVCSPSKRNEQKEAQTKTQTQAPIQSQYDIILQESRLRNIRVAVVSIVLAISNFVWQYSHPVTEVQLLFSMQQSSVPMSLVGNNGKPSVVDFWAPWCENCKFAAPTLRQVEEEYKDRVNFVMVNCGGTDDDMAKVWPYLEIFRVDAIPHLALVSADGIVETSLIGPTPKSVLEADLNVLLENAKRASQPLSQESQQQLQQQQQSHQPLPYVMLDVFANTPNQRKVHFDK